MTGSLSLAPLVLVAIIFMWTPPHFWALSLWRSEDYARAGLCMLPTVDPSGAITGRQMTSYCLALAFVSLAPALYLGQAGILYFVGAASCSGHSTSNQTSLPGGLPSW